MYSLDEFHLIIDIMLLVVACKLIINNTQQIENLTKTEIHKMKKSQIQSLMKQIKIKFEKNETVKQCRVFNVKPCGNTHACSMQKGIELCKLLEIMIPSRRAM